MEEKKDTGWYLVDLDNSAGKKIERYSCTIWRYGDSTSLQYMK